MAQKWKDKKRVQTTKKSKRIPGIPKVRGLGNPKHDKNARRHLGGKGL